MTVIANSAIGKNLFKRDIDMVAARLIDKCRRRRCFLMLQIEIVMSTDGGAGRQAPIRISSYWPQRAFSFSHTNVHTDRHPTKYSLGHIQPMFFVSLFTFPPWLMERSREKSWTRESLPQESFRLFQCSELAGDFLFRCLFAVRAGFARDIFNLA